MTTGSDIIVLNVDDQDAERYIKSRDLKLGGFSVMEARTGAEALRLVEELKPPVVLLDVQLPDISGYDVCSYIKRKWPEVMVLQTSATFTTSTDRIVGLDAGADSYLVQPAEPLELAAAINALLRIRKTEDALRKLNAGLEKQVGERTADLATANAKLMAEIVQREKAEQALVQSQKMEAIGQLTGGLAHDFNNLLTAVVGSLDMIRARATEPRVVRHAENALQAALRGSKLTAQLLAFSRTQKLVTEPIDVSGTIGGMRELLAQTVGINIGLEIRLADALPPAMADVNQLELAILNLSINARDAMPDGGTLEIATALDPKNPAFVTVSVADTGTGMPAHVIARAFDPFFTTKPPGKGTGLGLSQVYGVISQIGGDVAIDSEVGRGTRIRLSLPRAIGGVAETDGAAEETSGSYSERLLVVDDDPDVRDIIVQALADFGYHVEATGDGGAALELVETVRPDLMIIDFAMPGQNGAEVARRVRQRDATLPILFVSGHSDSSALEAGVEDAKLLRKPFRPRELAAAVRAALTRAAAKG